MSDIPRLRAGEGIFCWLLLAFCLFVLILSYRIAGFSSVVSPGAFPMGVAAIMAFSMVLVLLANRKREKPEVENIGEEVRQAVREVFPSRVLVYVALIGAYAFAIERLHFLPATSLFLVASVIYLKGTTVLKSLLVTAVTVTCIYAVFVYVFKVVVP